MLCTAWLCVPPRRQRRPRAPSLTRCLLTVQAVWRPPRAPCARVSPRLRGVTYRAPSFLVLDTSLKKTLRLARLTLESPLDAAATLRRALLLKTSQTALMRPWRTRELCWNH